MFISFVLFLYMEVSQSRYIRHCFHTYEWLSIFTKMLDFRCVYLGPKYAFAFLLYVTNYTLDALQGSEYASAIFI